DALLGADNAGRYRCLEAKRRADAPGPVAYLDCVRISNLGRHWVLLAFHANHGEVGGPIHPHHLGIILGRVAAKFHLDAVGLVHHVLFVRIYPALSTTTPEPKA